MGPRSIVLKLMLSLILSFGNNFGLDSYFLNFFNFYSSLEIDHDPPCSL